MSWKDILFFLIVASGVGLPLFAVYGIRPHLSRMWLRLLVLMIMAVVGVIAALSSHLLSQADFGTMFVRSWLIDGIAIYILTQGEQHGA